MATKVNHANRNARLSIEALEQRQLLASDFAILGSAAPPKVTAVKVASSTWSPEFLDAVDPDDVGYQIPHGSGTSGSPGQLSSLPWKDVQRIFVEFDADVQDVKMKDVELTGVSRELYEIDQVSYDDQAFRATIDLVSPISVDKLLLVVRDSVKADNMALDGEWVDATSTGSSGDGLEGGDFRFRFNVLPGDINQSGTVAVNDVGKLRTGLGTNAFDGNYSELADTNGSGVISVDDVSSLRENIGRRLPIGEPMAVGDVLSQRIRGTNNGGVTFVYDPVADDAQQTVSGLEDGDPDRIVATSTGPDGIELGFAENEMMVTVSDPSEIDAILARWNGRVIDGPDPIEELIPPITGNEDPEYIIFHQYLIQIDPNAVDVSRMATDLLAAEPYHSGEFRVSSYAGAATAAAAAYEYMLGSEVAMNFVAEDDSIANGSSLEAPTGPDLLESIGGIPTLVPFSRNAFDWPQIKSDSPEGFSVDLAWQLLEQHGKFGSGVPLVSMLIVDRGFSHSDDFSSDNYNHDFPFLRNRPEIISLFNGKPAGDRVLRITIACRLAVKQFTAPIGKLFRDE